MNGEDLWFENTTLQSDSGPIAIGQIMPAVLARYGLTGDERDDAVPVMAEWPPVASVLVEA